MILFLEAQKYCVGIQQEHWGNVTRTCSICQPLAIRPLNYFFVTTIYSKGKEMLDWCVAERKNRVRLIS